MSTVLLALAAASLTSTMNANSPILVPDRPALQEVPFSQVAIRDSFWSPRRETNRRVTLPHSLKMVERDGNIHNFELAAEGKTEGYRGYVFADSDLYKVLESASYSLADHPDPALEQQIDRIIELLARAQQKDGYLNTYYLVKEPGRRLTNLRDNHEIYCAGHLFEAAVAHFRATGKKTLLNVATKYADFFDRTFGPGKRVGYCGHPEAELALVKLYHATGERRYLDLANFMVVNRGSKIFAAEHNTPLSQYDGSYWQDDVPIYDHDRIKGHAVRAAYLMSGCVDVAAETGDARLLQMVDRVWRNCAYKNVYVTGGIGPSASNEGFTTDYDLPNLTAYQETCASVAMAMWNHRLNLLYGDAKYADLMETALYNGALAGVSLDGSKFFYVNPLESSGGHHRSEWFGCACCPPNISRTLASIGGYAYAVGKDSLWVNLYIQGGVRAQVAGHDVRLEVETRYPEDGKVVLEVEVAIPTVFEIRLRVPGWCEDASVKIDGKIESPKIEKGYLVLSRAWKSGDTVELDLPMPPRRIEASPSVEANRGLLAFARGPLVYCFEACDQEAPLTAVGISPDAPVAVKTEPSLLGGVAVLEVRGSVASVPDWPGGLYRTATQPKPTTLRAIPYYAWDNRQPGAMRVWMPVAPPPPRPVGGLERSAKIALSETSGYCRPNGIRDGMEPKGSGEQPAELCHFWPKKGSAADWVEYSWEHPKKLAKARVYWFDDTGRGECRLPKSWRLAVKQGDAWVPVELKSGQKYGIGLDRWFEVDFAPIATTAIRLEFAMQNGWSVGIHEWQVLPPDEDAP